jgi:predicted phage gp36 major capsid-like protein
VSDEVASLIANAISAALPQGDFVVTKKGMLRFSTSESLTSWQTAARLEGNIRGAK